MNRSTVLGLANLLQEFIHALTPSYKEAYYSSIKRGIALLIITWLISLSPLLSTLAQAQGDADLELDFLEDEFI